MVKAIQTSLQEVLNLLQSKLICNIYNGLINQDPVMTLTDLRQVQHRNCLNDTEEKKLPGNVQVDRIFMNLKKEINPRGYSDPVFGLYTCI